MNTQHSSKSLQHDGFTLLEVMVALLIFSVGLLGLAGLQASSLQNSKTADLRSIAVIAAHDMAERMRANQNGVPSGYSNITGAPTSYTNCVTSTCTSANQVATWDAYEWETSLSKLLPLGQGTVTRTSSTAPATIKVCWDEAHTGTSQKCYQTDVIP